MRDPALQDHLPIQPCELWAPRSWLRIRILINISRELFPFRNIFHLMNSYCDQGWLISFWFESSHRIISECLSVTCLDIYWFVPHAGTSFRNTRKHHGQVTGMWNERAVAKCNVYIEIRMQLSPGISFFFQSNNCMKKKCFMEDLDDRSQWNRNIGIAHGILIRYCIWTVLFLHSSEFGTEMLDIYTSPQDEMFLCGWCTPRADNLENNFGIEADRRRVWRASLS